jgi:NADH-quinone oxidoreductase subunit M
VLLGTFKSNLPVWLGVVATTAVILGAAYMLWMVQKVFFGQVTHQENLALHDLGRREVVAALPFILLIVVMGLQPQPFLDVLNHSTQRYVARARYASGEGPTDDSKVRVLVRALPPGALADARPTVVPAVPVPMPVRPMRLAPTQPQLQPATP